MKIKPTLRLTALVNGFSLFKIPLLAFCTPQVLEVSETQTKVRVRLDWRTSNHLGVMYFGALAMGAELSIALKAVEKIDASRKRIDFIFKDFQADFLKRADSHVLFCCDEADQVAKLIEEALQTEDRLEKTFSGYAVTEKKPDQAVMKYKLTLSVKNRS